MQTCGVFTRIIKQSKSAAHKNGDIDGTCKRGLNVHAQ